MARNQVSLPSDIKTKIYKTGQTRGADDDVIYQNRVGRNSTVLIPYDNYRECKDETYENGFIVLIKPEEFFRRSPESLENEGLVLGKNLLVFYETREQWNSFPPLKDWTVPNTRTGDSLNGEYVARVPALTSNDDNSNKIIIGYNDKKLKGAGIRVYEYASTETINKTKIQLEFLFWHCFDIEEFIKKSENPTAFRLLKADNERKAHAMGLDDPEKLKEVRIFDDNLHTICPLCLKNISAMGFCNKELQAEGREVPDLTVTNTSLFHINELRVGRLNHRPYNLGWGHHYCNVVVKDSGIHGTLEWMKEVLKNNGII